MLLLIIKWFFLVTFNVFLKYLVAWPITPIVVLFAQRKFVIEGDGSPPMLEYWLPHWLWWFQTPDASLDGDGGWKSSSRPFLNESNRFKRYINRCFWLWRNSLYGFNEAVLSVPFGIGVEKLVTIGNPDVGNGPGGRSGTVKRYYYRNGKLEAWQYYFIRRLKRFPHKCIRVNLGWKLFSFGNRFSGHAALSVWVNHFIP